MIIEDEGILVSKFKHGETSFIISILSKEYGLQKGLIKGGTSLRKKHLLEIGNIVKFRKKARNEESLGNIQIDLQQSYLHYIFHDNIKLLILSSICNLIEELIIEKERDDTFYIITKNLISILSKSDVIRYYLQWELKLLHKIGIGLDLTRCVVTNKKDNLYYISPKTGKAVVYEVGTPYHNKLFIMPELFRDFNANLTNSDIYNSLKILTYFLNMFCRDYHKKLPISRSLLLKKFGFAL